MQWAHHFDLTGRLGSHLSTQLLLPSHSFRPSMAATAAHVPITFTWRTYSLSLLQSFTLVTRASPRTTSSVSLSRNKLTDQLCGTQVHTSAHVYLNSVVRRNSRCKKNCWLSTPSYTYDQASRLWIPMDLQYFQGQRWPREIFILLPTIKPNPQGGCNFAIEIRNEFPWISTSELGFCLAQKRLLLNWAIAR